MTEEVREAVVTESREKPIITKSVEQPIIEKEVLPTRMEGTHLQTTNILPTRTEHMTTHTTSSHTSTFAAPMSSHMSTHTTAPLSGSTLVAAPLSRERSCSSSSSSSSGSDRQRYEHIDQYQEGAYETSKPGLGTKIKNAFRKIGGRKNKNQLNDPITYGPGGQVIPERKII